tara:strand:- start:1331 stop:1459 length:129 start_codon:yes stop_codon:yes gene_type:complete
MKTKRQALNNLLGISIKQKGIQIMVESKKYQNDINFQKSIKW